MQLQKWLWIPCAICLYLVAYMLTTNPSSKYSDKGSVKLKSLSSTTSLFDDNTAEEFVLDCISGEVIGVRPRHHVDTVDIRHLRTSHHHNELDSHRNAMFNEIFQKRVWGKYSKVAFSASGSSLRIQLAVQYETYKFSYKLTYTVVQPISLNNLNTVKILRGRW